MKEKKKFNKKVIIGIVVLLLVAAGVVLFLVRNSSDNREQLETSLTEMGKSFYENFYYEQIGSSADERASLLSKFTTVGIKVDLDNLGRYNNGEFKAEIKEFKNSKTDEECSKTGTKVIIYPKSPYGKTDYNIEVNLDCGFEEK